MGVAISFLALLGAGRIGLNLQEEESNYFQVLEAGRLVPNADIKRAYITKSLAWHPDKWRHSTDEEQALAELQFNKIREAYEVLSKPGLKDAYDKFGIDGVTRP